MLKLHSTTMRSSTFSGFKLALLGVTTLPATEKTRSDLDEAADSSSGNSWKDFVLHFVGHLELILLLLLLLLHHIRELLLVVCLKEVSQGFGGALANLDDQGWTWDDEYLLASVDLCASHLVGFYLHRRHFAMAPSISKVSLNFGCLFLRNHTVLLDGRHGCWWRDEYVVIIFQFFLNINSVPLHEMKLHKMT